MNTEFLMRDILDNVYVNEKNALNVTGFENFVIAGTSGTNGTSGIDGNDGLNGSNGTSGSSGSSGSSGVSIQGIQGIQGEQGYDGFDGSSGTSGSSGVSIQGSAGSSGSSGSSGIDGSVNIPEALLYDDISFEFRDLIIGGDNIYIIDLEPSYLYRLSGITLQSDNECNVIFFQNWIELFRLNSYTTKNTYFKDNIITGELSIKVETTSATLLRGKLKNKLII